MIVPSAYLRVCENCKDHGEIFSKTGSSLGKVNSKDSAHQKVREAFGQLEIDSFEAKAAREQIDNSRMPDESKKYFVTYDDSDIVAATKCDSQQASVKPTVH